MPTRIVEKEGSVEPSVNKPMGVSGDAPIDNSIDMDLQNRLYWWFVSGEWVTRNDL